MTNFTICYTVINFENGTQKRVEKTFISADNTRAYVAMLNKCDDVLNIDVINGMTGEVLDEFNVSASKPEPKAAPDQKNRGRKYLEASGKSGRRTGPRHSSGIPSGTAGRY